MGSAGFVAVLGWARVDWLGSGGVTSVEFSWSRFDGWVGLGWAWGWALCDLP